MDYKSIMSKISNMFYPSSEYVEWKNHIMEGCGFRSTGGITKIKRLKEFPDGYCGIIKNTCVFCKCPRMKEN